MGYVSWAYMIKPANEALTQERTKVQTLSAKLEELERANATAKDLSAQLKKIEEAIQAFESKLPPSSEIHTVLQDVTLIAQRHGLTPKSIRTHNNKNNRGYIEQPIAMELTGNFNSYYAFLLEVEQLDRITKIRELELKKAQKEGQTEATFVMSIFFQNAA
jgi:type IV pilus assembly protein PilO